MPPSVESNLSRRRDPPGRLAERRKGEILWAVCAGIRHRTLPDAEVGHVRISPAAGMPYGPVLRAPTNHLLRRVLSWPRKVLITLAVIATVLLVGRIALPVVVRRVINSRLERIPGYTGHVDDVRIHLWRGAYTLHGFGIYRQTGLVQEPFFLARGIDISLAWREVARGRFVSNIRVDQGQLHFVKGASDEASQTDFDRRWQDVQLVEPFGLIVFDPQRQDVPLPSHRGNVESLKLSNHLEQTVRATTPMRPRDAVMACQKPQEDFDADRFDLLAQAIQREPMNAGQQSAMTPFRGGLKVEG